MQMNYDQPLVSVLTPVFNGGRFLRDCIESVRAQDYQNWDYHIVDNCSTDDTLQIAKSYTAMDRRIRVTTNPRFVSMPQNFNNAFRLVSPASRYFKVVCADDWLLPECLSKMVRFAETHPSVGILCCHQQSGTQIRWNELGPSVSVLPGRDACRKVLLEGARLFGAPTAFLYRSNLLRLGKPFFPNDQPHSDTSACFEFLEYCDYGVVSEVLAAERVHPGQISSQIDALAAGDLAFLETLLEYGPRYLSEAEYGARSKAAFDAYYRGLGGAVWKLKNDRFWQFQRSRLAEMGHILDRLRVARSAIAEVLAEAKTPVIALQKIRIVLRTRLER